MSRPDIWAALAADPASMIILDLRSRHFAEVAAKGALDIAKRWSLDSPTGRVHAALLAPRDRSGTLVAPSAIALDDVRYVRLVDRFLLPENPGPVVSATLFDIVASHYNHLTRQTVNTQVAESLLRAVSNGRPGRQIVLDFGCGTGVAQLSAKRLAAEGINIELLGTDLSEAMLCMAAEMGGTVIPLARWRSLETDRLDGAIAVFVLHYGIPQEELATLASQLKMDARFAANYFKPPQGAISLLTSFLETAGMQLERKEPMGMTNADNVLLVFRKVGSGDVGPGA